MLGNGYICGHFVHVDSDPNFNKSDVLRWESEILWTCTAANALHTTRYGHSKAQYSSLRLLQTIITTGESQKPFRHPFANDLSSLGICTYSGWGEIEPLSLCYQASAWTTVHYEALQDFQLRSDTCNWTYLMRKNERK